MLISHRNQFIFTKTVKTAGTSLESYFERYCMPEREWSLVHERNEHVSTEGIVGARRSEPADAVWYNHMSARNIRNRIGTETWNRYFKFTAIRNPFDKLVSGFFMFDRPGTGQPCSKADPIYRFRKWVQWFGNLARNNEGLIRDDEVPHFLKPIECSLIDRDKYLIDGGICVDYFIRFEHLVADLRVVCKAVQVPFEPDSVPRFNADLRAGSIPLAEFYDQDTVRAVQELYGWELEQFDYAPP